ncbi:hypothetical protein [Wolbachia endosymbiont (group E) of Neria commutata]
MAISYVKIARTPYVFRQLTGLTTEEFEKAEVFMGFLNFVGVLIWLS